MIIGTVRSNALLFDHSYFRQTCGERIAGRLHREETGNVSSTGKTER